MFAAGAAPAVDVVVGLARAAAGEPRDRPVDAQRRDPHVVAAGVRRRRRPTSPRLPVVRGPRGARRPSVVDLGLRRRRPRLSWCLVARRVGRLRSRTGAGGRCGSDGGTASATGDGCATGSTARSSRRRPIERTAVATPAWRGSRGDGARGRRRAPCAPCRPGRRPRRRTRTRSARTKARTVERARRRPRVSSMCRSIGAASRSARRLGGPGWTGTVFPVLVDWCAVRCGYGQYPRRTSWPSIPHGRRRSGTAGQRDARWPTGGGRHAPDGVATRNNVAARPGRRSAPGAGRLREHRPDGRLEPRRPRSLARRRRTATARPPRTSAGR